MANSTELNMLDDVVQVAEDYHIDISGEIKKFEEHLSLNDRVIFSAKYGDGKTYFLNKFKKENEDKYLFLTIYPVNYQVADSNKDIFELIKRDILVQLCANGIVLDDQFIKEDVAAYYYLTTNIEDVISGCLDMFSKIPIKGKEVFSGISFLLKQKIKYDEFKMKIEKEGGIEEVICSIDHKSLIYNHDYITELITQSIHKYYSENGKKIVLIVEDLDRIDPAQIFRILNIFSAHIDRDNMSLGEKIDIANTNKYGIHKVITVCDYYNIRNIFNHLYGASVDFNGYIKKFTTIGHFDYSILELAKADFIDRINSFIGFELDLQKLFDDLARFTDRKSFSIREMSTILQKIGRNINVRTIETPSFMIKKFSSQNSLTKMLSLFSLLNIARGRWLDSFQTCTKSLADRIRILDGLIGYTNYGEKIKSDREFNIYDHDSVCVCNIVFKEGEILLIINKELMAYNNQVESIKYEDAINEASKYILHC